MTETPTPAGINPRESGTAPLDLRLLFGNDRPVILEIGSGKGRFLLDSARRDPQRNFLGIEKSLHYYRVIVRRLEHAGLSNAKIINFDAYPVVRDMFAAGSICQIHIYFPDPWPRKREQKRRIIRTEVLKEFERVLEDDGVAYYVTDHRDYFEAALPELNGVFDVEVVPPEVPREPRTNYEAKYRTEGRPIYEAVLRKNRSR